MGHTPGSGSLDLIVRGGTPATTGAVRGYVPEGADIRLFGTLAVDDDPGSLQPVLVRIPAEDVRAVQITEPDAGRATFLVDEQPTSATIRDLSVTPAIEGRYEIHAGVLENGGSNVDFVAVSDPLHLLVVGLAVLVVGCAVTVGVAYVMGKVEARTSGFVEECRRRGGFPRVLPEIGFGLNLAKLEVGCTAKPGVPQCLDLDGEPIQPEIPLPEFEVDILDVELG